MTAALTLAMQAANHSVVALKPIAAGCEEHDGLLKNSDALTLISVMNQDFDYHVINPIALKPAIAPHIAARQQGVEISVERLQQLCQLDQFEQSCLLIEGAGGWLVPLNERQSFADYVVAEKLAVILVVGLKLGCINHALLSREAILSRGLTLVGWVANHIDPNMCNQQENIATLELALQCPKLGEIPFIRDKDKISVASQCVSIKPLV